MFRILFWSLIVGLMGVSGGCRNERSANKLIPIEDFFVKPERTNFKISPNGEKVAYIGIEDHCRNIFVLDLVDPERSKQLTYESDMNVQYFFWVSDSMLVYAHAHSPVDSLRIYSISLDTEKSVPLLPAQSSRLRWLDPQKSYGNYLLASRNNRDSSVFDLYKIFFDGTQPELITENPGNVIDWIASPDGKVRLAMTSDSVQESILYRASEEEAFKQVAISDYQTLIKPLGYVKNSSTHVYALSNENRDKLALVEYNVAEGKEERVVYAHDEVDLSSSGYSTNLQELVYSQYTVDEEELHFFNAAVAQKFQYFTQKFAGQSIDILDSDTSLNHWLIKVSTDVDAGRIYFYDATHQRIELLSELNEKLKEAPLQPMEAISFQARDGLTLHGYLTYPRGTKRKGLPVVVLVHDGPYRRESMNFDAEAQFLANRGYLVFQLNYRGSAGYGKQFWAAGFKEWGGKIQADIIDGVTWLIHQGIVDKNRVGIMGTGFGGYSALHAATYNSSFYRCAISMSGYTNLFTYFKEIPPYHQKYVRLVHRIIGDPVGEAGLFKAISPVFHADKVNIPVLFAQGGRDRFSSLTDANQFVQKVKNNNIPIRYIYKEEEGRRFRTEENMVTYYQEVEAFLAQYLK